MGEIMDTKKPDPVARAARLLRESAQELRETATLPPLHQWTREDDAMARAAHDEYVAAADALEAWEISVGAPLRTGYDAARLEIESLQARIQELGQMARDCNSRRVMELQAELVKESARTAAEKLRADQMAEQHRMQCEMSKADRAKVQELEAMLAAVGAGGMEPLRKRECLHSISEPEAQPVGVAPEWWRKRADEIEADVARGSSIAAMTCYTKMRQLLQAATSPQPAPQSQADARDALEEAASVLSSINKGASHEVTVDDEVCYWQRKEWIDWAEKEVLPKVRAAIAAAKGE